MCRQHPCLGSVWLVTYQHGKRSSTNYNKSYHKEQHLADLHNPSCLRLPTQFCFCSLCYQCHSCSSEAIQTGQLLQKTWWNTKVFSPKTLWTGVFKACVVSSNLWFFLLSQFPSHDTCGAKVCGTTEETNSNRRCYKGSGTEPSLTFLQKNTNTEQCVGSLGYTTTASCFWHRWTESQNLRFESTVSEADDTTPEFLTRYIWSMLTYFYHCLFCTVLGMSGVTGAALRETSCINRSLSALADVLGAIAEQRSHVPYRNSKLTHLLQDSVGEGLFWLLFNNRDFISQYFLFHCCAEPEVDPMLTLLLSGPLVTGSGFRAVWVHCCFPRLRSILGIITSLIG